jgi:mannose-6-phosphate isomerase-like protein (cupin superfamily)
MKKSLIVLAVTVLTIIAGLVGVAQAQKGKQVIYVSSAQVIYKPSPMSGVSMQALWGEMDKGPHATFTKFDPGYDAGMHTHTNDVSLVVIKGAYLYKDEAGEKRVGPGEFLFVPGGHKHWSGGDKTEGALFYEEGSGKFDTIPAK